MLFLQILIVRRKSVTVALPLDAQNTSCSRKTYAGVAELADAQDLKSCCSDTVPVRFRSRARYFFEETLILQGFFFLGCLRGLKTFEDTFFLCFKMSLGYLLSPDLHTFLHTFHTSL